MNGILVDSCVLLDLGMGDAITRSYAPAWKCRFIMNPLPTAKDSLE